MKYCFLLITIFTFTQWLRADSSLVLQSDTLVNKIDTALQIIPNKIDSTEIQKPVEVRERFQGRELWVFIVCCLTFFLAGINRRINEKKHDQSVLGFMKLGPLGQATDRSFYEFNIHQLIGLVVHNLIVALWSFYFLQNTEYHLVENNLLFFILLFFLVSFVYMFKFFFQYLALNILQINDLPVLLVKCTIGLGYFASLISLPLFMISYYIQYEEWHQFLTQIFFVIIIGYLAFRAIKYLQLFTQFFKGSIFYNILYFCGLELIPLLVFVKICFGVFK